MPKITYDEKFAVVFPGLPVINLVTDLNMNEIKAVVNALDDVVAASIPRLLPPGGAQGQFLTKTAGGDYVVGWGSAPIPSSIQAPAPGAATMAASGNSLAGLASDSVIIGTGPSAISLTQTYALLVAADTLAVRAPNIVAIGAFLNSGQAWNPATSGSYARFENDTAQYAFIGYKTSGAGSAYGILSGSGYVEIGKQRNLSQPTWIPQLRISDDGIEPVLGLAGAVNLVGVDANGMLVAAPLGAGGGGGSGFGTWAGAWSGATAYSQNAIVSSDGSSWIALADNSNVLPGSNPAIWALVAQAGDIGPEGLVNGGNFNPAVAYDPKTVVYFESNIAVPGSYVVLSTTVASETPDSSPAKFQLLARNGAVGATGAVGFVQRGNYNPATAYALNDVVYFASIAVPGSYQAVAATNAGETPVTHPAKWTLVAKDGVATGYVGRFETIVALPGTSLAGQWAIVDEGPQLAIDDGAGGWTLQFFQSYDILAGTRTNLENNDNWTASGVYAGPAINAADLRSGKRAINTSNAGLEYFCIGAAGSEYWVRLYYGQQASGASGGDPDDLGYFANEAALIAAHPTPTLGQHAIIGADSLPRVCSVAGQWSGPTFDQYGILQATIVLLSDEASWWGAAGPNMYDPAAPTIASADLVVGKKYVHPTENVLYECVQQGTSPVWIRSGNRIPYLIEAPISEQGFDATTGTKKVTFLSEGDFFVTGIEASVGNVAHNGGAVTCSVIATVAGSPHATFDLEFPNLTNYLVLSSGFLNVGGDPYLPQGTRLEFQVDVTNPTTKGQGGVVKLKGFAIMKRDGQGGGGGGAFNPLTFFDSYLDFSQQGDFVTDPGGFDNGDGLTTYFESAPTMVVANQSAPAGDEFFSNNTTGHAVGAGWVVVPGVGIKLWQSEISVKVRMWDGVAANGLNHGSADDFIIVHDVLLQNGISEATRKKFNGPSDKWQSSNPFNWKHDDNYEIVIDGGVTDATSVSMFFPANYANGTRVFFAKYRDRANRRYCQWIAPIVNGNTAADLGFMDTITKSTADGQALYLRNASREDTASQIEHFYQEGTTLLHYGYKKVANGQFVAVDAAIKALYEQFCNNA